MAGVSPVGLFAETAFSQSLVEAETTSQPVKWVQKPYQRGVDGVSISSSITMTYCALANVTTLHNALQRNDQKHTLLAWNETFVGPSNSRTWTVTCRYKGVVYGQGSAGNKSDAKDAAAAEAYQRLIVEGEI
ncbi:hypothetical protein BDN72DRAFT_891250 [Pluteus cervinus]|uniref:Uncharacterized protein n=1 Tax=Pluteus cervinus TaxID=181527 RepID=A0ACD3BII4_9AGAR|nr:hypothetical protein BDN72DRAFT_891250 [Pluteus cervinus]